MESKRGISVFWLGLLGFILFPLGITAIVLGFHQVKQKTATGWTKVGLVLGIASVGLTLVCLALVFFFLESINLAFSPPHKAVPLVAPIPTAEVNPPFETPENFVTGYNQLIQKMFAKGGIGSIDFTVSKYFDIKDEVLQNAQRDLNSCHKLYLAASDKFGEEQAKELLTKIAFFKASYIRPQTLKQKSENTYDAIDTTGDDVVLKFAPEVGWKKIVTDNFSIDIFKSVAKPLSGIIDSITKRIQNGELKTVDSVVTALESGLNNIVDEQD